MNFSARCCVCLFQLSIWGMIFKMMMVELTQFAKHGYLIGLLPYFPENKTGSLYLFDGDLIN